MHLWDWDQLDLFTCPAIADGYYIGIRSRRKWIRLGLLDAIEDVWRETLV